jgi:ubiquinone/menaquinone biosynthesis C-methylase UbiE
MLYSDVAVSKRIADRRVNEAAAFLLPHLKPGMSIVDAGCGPGSITLGLADAVRPGPVLGIDIEPAQVERATTSAAASGIDNVRFEAGSVYALPVPDASIDAVFAHAVLVHLDEPERALKEFRRVLRPGGVVAVREFDSSSLFFEPSTPLLEAIVSLCRRFFNRSLPDLRGLRALLLAAGFAETAVHASGRYWGSREEMPKVVIGFESIFHSAAFRQTASEEGWADPEALEVLLAALRTWAQRPDAFCAQWTFAALGWAN